MGAYRKRRIDPDTADRLLAGDVGGPKHLADLLHRAAAPARPGELAGEDAAVMAFWSARRAPVPGGRRPSTLRPAWAASLSLKVAAVAFVATAGGLALAAGTGVLPNPLRDDTPAAVPVSTSHAWGDGRSSAGAGPASPASASPRATPSPALVGLCHAYQERVATNPGMALDSPAFASLIAAADGKDRVPAYCEALLSNESPVPKPKPSKSGGHPTGPPSPHPSGLAYMNQLAPPPGTSTTDTDR